MSPTRTPEQTVIDHQMALAREAAADMRRLRFQELIRCPRARSRAEICRTRCPNWVQDAYIGRCKQLRDEAGRVCPVRYRQAIDSGICPDRLFEESNRQAAEGRPIAP